MKNYIAIICMAMFALCSCSGSKFSAEALMLDPAAFDTEYEGKSVGLFTLTNKNGMVVQVTNYGSRVASIIVPD